MLAFDGDFLLTAECKDLFGYVLLVVFGFPKYTRKAKLQRKVLVDDFMFSDSHWMQGLAGFKLLGW